MSKRVVVGLSGGVDSSVAAYLLLEQGYEVIGLFMRNWHDEEVIIDNECPWVEDSNDALLVAQALGIPFQVVDLSKAYKERIVDYMFAEYKAGRTPNPDVLCNREIKFDIFLKTALELGADYVATGHYCQKDRLEKNGQIVYQLKAGADSKKDQSYFLCQLSQEQLKYALFPIGHLEKAEVRKIAAAQGLVTAEKKDSQGLCFVGKIRLPEFLQQQLAPKKGAIIEVPANAAIYSNYLQKIKAATDNLAWLKAICQPYIYQPSMGVKVGEHDGAHYFTIGQRKGLRVGGTGEPLFVIGTDTNENIIYTGRGKQHLGLYRGGLFIPNKDIHWVRPDLEIPMNSDENFLLRIRYRQALQEATIYRRADGFYIVFKAVQRGITAGQFAAWYKENELVGSGVIA